MGISPNHIPYVNLQAQWKEEKDELLPIIEKVLSSGQYVGGEELDKFEENIAKLCGVKYATGLNSGTDALIFALHLSGIGKGDEVITPPNSFISSTSAIINVGATPVFADIDPNTLTLDPQDIEDKITDRTKAIMVVHWRGMPADLDSIMNIARHYDIKVVEDNAVSQGTLYRGRMLGSIGDSSAISFQDGKLTSAGEGGVFMTNDAEVYQRAATLGHYERLKDLPDPKWRNVSGFSFGEKYRMATMTAAVAVVQMKHWDQRLETRKENDIKLGQTISEIKGFSVPAVPDYVESRYLRGYVQFHPQELAGITRERLIEALNAEGAQVQSPARKDSRIPHTQGQQRMLHKHPVFAGNDHGTEEILWEVLGFSEPRVDYKKVSLPVTEDPELPYDMIQLPSFSRPAGELINEYATAFDKIALNANSLARGSTGA